MCSCPQTKGEQGYLPDSGEDIRDALPEIAMGMLSDGGVATRYSRRCGERVEVRTILFTATHVGTEQITLYGDAIEIHVS